MLPAKVHSKNYNIIKPTLVHRNKDIHLSQILSVDTLSNLGELVFVLFQNFHTTNSE